jgi:hypothetical protein
MDGSAVVASVKNVGTTPISRVLPSPDACIQGMQKFQEGDVGVVDRHAFEQGYLRFCQIHYGCGEYISLDVQQRVH